MVQYWLHFYFLHILSLLIIQRYVAACLFLILDYYYFCIYCCMVRDEAANQFSHLSHVVFPVMVRLTNRAIKFDFHCKMEQKMQSFYSGFNLTLHKLPFECVSFCNTYIYMCLYISCFVSLYCITFHVQNVSSFSFRFNQAKTRD
jgi:hypothetical protein